MLYHVFTKSIARFVTFNNDVEFQRMVDTLKYYRVEKTAMSFSDFLRLKEDEQKAIADVHKNRVPEPKYIEIAAFCIMPTHIHLLLKELKKGAISTYMSNTLNSYTRYFNRKHGRKGPLWQGRSKKKRVATDEILLHLTRYLHLNPVTAHLVDKPEDWKYSSYAEYTGGNRNIDRLCAYRKHIYMDTPSYRLFVESQIDYQRQLALVQKLTFD